MQGHQMAAQKAEERQESLGKLLGQLATDCAALVKDEIELAEQEIKEKAASLRMGLVALCIGVIVGAIALAILCFAAVIGLGDVIGYGVSALVIGIFLAIVASVLAGIGLVHIKQTSLRPEQTIDTLGDGKEWLKEMK
jgi:uncharacterized membrane protein YqjE